MGQRGKQKRSSVETDKPSDEQFPGHHSPDCKCSPCTEKREKQQERLKAKAEAEKKSRAKKERKIRNLYVALAKFKVGMMTFWSSLHGIISAMLSFVTVITLVAILWLLISRLWSGEWIVPVVCLGALVVIGRVNERLDSPTS